MSRNRGDNHGTFLLFLLVAFWSAVVEANTEKVIFSAPNAAPVALSNRVNTVGELSAARDAEKLLLRIELPRAFPAPGTPRGVDSWVYLGGLKTGARYEARVCWAATAPSDFWMSIHASLDSLPQINNSQDKDTSSGNYEESHLYLKISATAAYFTVNETLMEYPEPVLVDIILDEFLLGVLPRSLVNVGMFVIAMAGVAWYLGKWILKLIENLAKEAAKGKKE